MEPIVQESVVRFLSQLEFREDLLSDGKKIHEQSGAHAVGLKLRKKIQSLNLQLDILAQRLSELPASVSPEPIYRQMERLEKERIIQEEALSETQKKSRHLADSISPLHDYEAWIKGMACHLPKMLADDKAVAQALIHEVVQKIEVLPEGVKIHFKVGKSYVLNSLEILKKSPPSGEGSGPTTVLLNFSGSKTLQNGGPWRT